MRYKILANGVIGVPVTIVEYLNEAYHMKIVGNEYTLGISKGRGYVNKKRMYSRIFISFTLTDAPSQKTG